MRTKTTILKGAKAAFNHIKVTKGQYTSIATCDTEGNPNVAPIGSMRIVDDHTVHVLQGFLPKTMENLRSNPKATFSVCLPPRMLDFISLFNENKDCLGYQVYCELEDIDASKDAVEREYRHIVDRVPRLLRRFFLKFCEKNLKQLLKFRIKEVREIGGM